MSRKVLAWHFPTVEKKMDGEHTAEELVLYELAAIRASVNAMYACMLALFSARYHHHCSQSTLSNLIAITSEAGALTVAQK